MIFWVTDALNAAWLPMMQIGTKLDALIVSNYVMKTRLQTMKADPPLLLAGIPPRPSVIDNEELIRLLRLRSSLSHTLTPITVTSSICSTSFLQSSKISSSLAP